MKKISTALAISSVLLTTTSLSYADSGIFGTGVAISSDIGGSSTFNLYEITLLGDSRLAPNTSGGGSTLGAPTLVNTDGGGGTSSWQTGSPSLGNFTLGMDTLTLNGGELLTYKNSGSDVTAANVFYRIDGGSFNQINLSFNQDNVNGSFGDQRWYSDTADIDLLDGLNAGMHTLSIYFRDSNTDRGNDYVSVGGNNYNVSFTVEATPTPEPSSIALLGMSGLATVYLFRRRR